MKKFILGLTVFVTVMSLIGTTVGTAAVGTVKTNLEHRQALMDKTIGL